jgi:hypothetical protein
VIVEKVKRVENVIIVERESLFFVFLTLVTINRWSEKRPRNTGNQDGDVVSDGRGSSILIAVTVNCKLSNRK